MFYNPSLLMILVGFESILASSNILSPAYSKN